MHMADALLSPPVAAAMYAASGAAACACVKVLRKDENTVKLPAMAVASAFDGLTGEQCLKVCQREKVLITDTHDNDQKNQHSPYHII